MSNLIGLFTVSPLEILLILLVGLLMLAVPAGVVLIVVFLARQKNGTRNGAKNEPADDE